MAAGVGTEPLADGSTSDDDFEFCIVSSGAVAEAGVGAKTDMCVADELFSNGKLLPLRPSSAAGSDGPAYVLLPRSESAASTAGFGSRSDSRSASSSGSSSGCVSRCQSSSSAASSDHHGAPAPPQRRSLSSSLLYTHPSPSPQLRWARPRRSTGSAAPPAAWGIFRLGVAGAPDVYPPRSGEAKNAAAVARGGGSSRSARFEQGSAAAVARGGGSRSARFEHQVSAAPAAAAAEKKTGLGLFGDSFGCKCSPGAVEPVRVPAARAKQSRNKDGVKTGTGVRRSRILYWLEELSITKQKK